MDRESLCQRIGYEAFCEQARAYGKSLQDYPLSFGVERAYENKRSGAKVWIEAPPFEPSLDEFEMVIWWVSQDTERRQRAKESPFWQKDIPAYYLDGSKLVAWEEALISRIDPEDALDLWNFFLEARSVFYRPDIMVLMMVEWLAMRLDEMFAYLSEEISRSNKFDGVRRDLLERLSENS